MVPRLPESRQRAGDFEGSARLLIDFVAVTVKPIDAFSFGAEIESDRAGCGCRIQADHHTVLIGPHNPHSVILQPLTGDIRVREDRDLIAVS
jgi:hypothetical protein